MKIERIKILYEALRSGLNDAEGVSMHYWSDGKWHSIDACLEESNQDVIGFLDKARESGEYHKPAAPVVWFYFEDVSCCISVTFSKSPRKSTRDSFREKIVKIKSDASNAYKVSHHTLTHLLAKDAFRERLKNALELIKGVAPKSVDVQESELPKTLAVFALDIDHFKQVNDTWGHLYGDQVLKAFGRRLEEAAESIRLKEKNPPDICIGHPSGEEFLVLIQANSTREKILQWANEFRTKISDDVLPSEAEWLWLKGAENLAVLTPPLISERSITASIGVTIYSGSMVSEFGHDLSAALLEKADTALYRAKAGGRDKVIFFDDILSSCGRILEQDSVTGVVAIDIGQNVGVSVGHEFKVFPSTFSGGKKFFVNDGRTTRALGMYPRVESARIIVFNVQPEISFAYVPEGYANIVLEEGSHLEAIPAGSIGHLLPNSSRFAPAQSDSVLNSSLGSLQEFIEGDVSGDRPFAVVFRFSNESEYLRKYGTAALNAALARLYQAAQTKFISSRLVALLDRGSMCVVGDNETYKGEVVEEIVGEMSLESPELGLMAGVFSPADYEWADEGVVLEKKHAIDFARFAASERGKRARVRNFSLATVRSVIMSLREDRLFNVAYEDFKRLKAMGVNAASLDNMGGLVCSNMGHHNQAFLHYEAAMSKVPDEIVFKSNAATAAYYLDEHSAEAEIATRALSGMQNEQIYSLVDVHDFGFFSYAFLLAKARLRNLPYFNKEKFDLVAKAALALENFSAQERLVIQEAIAIDEGGL